MSDINDAKSFIQAQHRLEAIEARDRQKERKERTRHLIQMGAILVNVFPDAKNMDLELLKDFLNQKLNIN